MKLKNLTNEELEAMSYTELAELILNESGKQLKVVDIFKKICKAKGMSDSDFENQIADFFELISTDKTFIVLEKGYCDLRKKHTPTAVVIEEDEEELVDNEAIEAEKAEEEVEETEEDIYYDSSSDDDIDDDVDDELNDFIVVDEDEAGN